MDTQALPIDPELCELAGDGAVQRSELNLLIRRVSRYHLTPMKQQLSETDTKLDAHVTQCALNQAKIMGGLQILIWLVGSGFGVFIVTEFARYMGWIQ